MSPEIGNGAVKASSAMAAGGSDGYGRGGNEQSFKVKKGEKVKDIAKADGESIFILVSTIYKTQIDANSLDSIRPMKKIDRKVPATTKKARGKKA